MRSMLDLTQNRYSSQWRAENAIGFDPIVYKWALIEGKISGNDATINVTERNGRPQIAFSTTVEQSKYSQGIANAKKFVDSEENKVLSVYDRYVSELKKVRDAGVALEKANDILESSGYRRGDVSFEPGSPLYKKGAEPTHKGKSEQLLKAAQAAAEKYQLAISSCVSLKNKIEEMTARLPEDKARLINKFSGVRPHTELADKMGV